MAQPAQRKAPGGSTREEQEDREDTAAPSRANTALNNLQQTVRFNPDLHSENCSQSAQITCKAGQSSNLFNRLPPRTPSLPVSYTALSTLCSTDFRVATRTKTVFSLLFSLFDLSAFLYFRISFPTLFHQTGLENTSLRATGFALIPQVLHICTEKNATLIQV